MRAVVDMVIEKDEIPEMIARYEKKGITVEVVTLSGQGGGWPEIAFIGDETELAAALAIEGYAVDEIMWENR